MPHGNNICHVRLRNKKIHNNFNIKIPSICYYRNRYSFLFRYHLVILISHLAKKPFEHIKTFHLGILIRHLSVPQNMVQDIFESRLLATFRCESKCMYGTWACTEYIIRFIEVTNIFTCIVKVQAKKDITTLKQI